MPLLIPIAVTVGAAGVTAALIAGFLRGIRWGLRRRMHRLSAERARQEEAHAPGE